MKISAIIAEYNPLHRGHQLLLTHARDLGNVVMVVMGGDFCQRGGSMVLDKYTRAAHAIRAGADIVVELPTAFAANCADRFAFGATRLLRALDADVTLTFGSEEGDLSKLAATASLLRDEPAEIQAAIREGVRVGIPYPMARQQSIARYADEHGLSLADVTLPNNILAIEYLRHGTGLAFDTIRRTEPYAADRRGLSSQWIREHLSQPLDDVVPPDVACDLASIRPEQDVLYLAAARNWRPDEVLYDAGDGLQQRILQAAEQANFFDEALRLAATKRYTSARIRRAYTHTLLHLTADLYDRVAAEAPYYNVLAVRRSRTALLSALDRAGRLYTGREQQRQGTPSAQLDAEAHAIYRLLRGVDVPLSMRVIED